MSKNEKGKAGAVPKERHCPQCKTVFDLSHPKAPHCEECNRTYGHLVKRKGDQKKVRNLTLESVPEKKGKDPFDPKSYPQHSSS